MRVEKETVFLFNCQKICMDFVGGQFPLIPFNGETWENSLRIKTQVRKLIDVSFIKGHLCHTSDPFIGMGQVSYYKLIILENILDPLHLI